MINIKDVSKGFYRLLIKDAEVENISIKRWKVCNECFERRGNKCAVCGCYLPAKTRCISDTNDCPDGNWFDVGFYRGYANDITELKENIYHYLDYYSKRERYIIRSYLFEMNDIYSFPKTNNGNPAVEYLFKRARLYILWLKKYDNDNYIALKKKFKFTKRGKKD